jgi:hypothetical protein
MAKKKILNNRNVVNKHSSKKNFALRKYYLTHVVPTGEYSNFFDASLMPYYGKVDTRGNIVYPSETYLVPLYRNTDSSADTVYAMNFVADAFTDLQNYINKANRIGVLVQENKNVQSANPVRGWDSVHTRYAAHIKSFYQSIVSSYLERPSEGYGLQHSKPHNFDQYMTSLKELYKTKGGDLALTRSTYIMSNDCTNHISGLVIEITPTMDYSDDAAKNFTFIESSNFKFYMHALKKFGFMADKEYPGRIIADLTSPVMQEYILKHLADESTDITDINDLEDMFNICYYKAKDYDYDLVRAYLVQFYNNYVITYPVVSQTTGIGKLSTNRYFFRQRQLTIRETPLMYTSEQQGCKYSNTQLIERTPLSENDLETTYDQDFWLPVYAEFLNYELKNPLTEHQLEKTIKNAKDLKKNVDFDTAIGYIGDKFNFYRYPARDLSLANYEDAAQTTDVSSPSSGNTTSGGY